jgi:hypothetical protein
VRIAAGAARERMRLAHGVAGAGGDLGGQPVDGLQGLPAADACG